METWMILQGVGGLLGLVALVGMVMAFRKMEAPKKWVAIGGLAIVGAGGGFLVANATALSTTEEEEAIQEEVEQDDFDSASFDDDF